MIDTLLGALHETIPWLSQRLLRESEGIVIKKSE